MINNFETLFTEKEKSQIIQNEKELSSHYYFCLPIVLLCLFPSSSLGIDYFTYLLSLASLITL